MNMQSPGVGVDVGVGQSFVDRMPDALADQLMANGLNWYAVRAHASRQIRALAQHQGMRGNAEFLADPMAWFDGVVLPPARQQLSLVSTLFGLGLTRTIENVLRVPEILYQARADMDQEATVSMAVSTQPLEDRADVKTHRAPIPIYSHGFRYDLRHFEIGQGLGANLDTTNAEAAGRKVAEKIEDVVANGVAIVDGGVGPVYGLLNHPNRNTASFGANGNWLQAAKTGADVVTDIETMITALEGDLYFGPYVLLLPSSYQTRLSVKPFQAGSDRMILDVIRAMPQISQVITVRSLPANNVVLFAARSDVIQLIDGDFGGALPGARSSGNMDVGGGRIIVVPWTEQGGTMLRYRVLGSINPLVRSTYAGQSGIFHMS